MEFFHQLTLNIFLCFILLCTVFFFLQGDFGNWLSQLGMPYNMALLQRVSQDNAKSTGHLRLPCTFRGVPSKKNVARPD